jgi:CRP-like cAMP-binding protein
MVQLSLPMADSIWHNDSAMKQKSLILERNAYAKGERVCTEGDPAMVAYLVQMGSVKVFVEKEGKRIELATLETGQIFGESALVGDPGLRTASVEAAEDTNLIVIRKDVFEKKLQGSDPTIRAVLEMLIKRMVRSNSTIVEYNDVSLEQFISSLNATFENILNAIPDNKQDDFKQDTFPLMKQIISVMEKHRKSIEKGNK